jgi:ferrous iron transport protein B
LLLDVDGYLETRFVPEADGPLGRELHAARRRLAEAGCELPGVETTVRYDWIGRVLDGVLDRPDLHKVTASDRIDLVLTHRFWGTTILLLVMIVIFQSVFTWAGPLMELVDGTFGAIGGWVEAHTARGALQSLLVDGVIGGVGGVVIFLPQILILFFFIALLEDCGYMARAAFLMDKLMVRVGLSGKSFIPMLSSFACAVPGIMAARVISDERHRLTTILVAPLMTCSARLPIYTLLIAAFIPQRTYAAGLLNLQGLVLVSLYLLGIVTAVVVALVLKRTILRGGSQPFVMELPSYKWPTPRTIFHRVSQRGWTFLKTAGTMILAVSILVWAALYYPHDAELVEAPFRPQQQQLRAQLDRLEPDDDAGRAAIDKQLADLDRQIQGAYQRQSFLGRSGRLIEPVVKPLGWDWRIGCAVIASFPAREVVVATLGVIYNLGEDVDEESRELRAMLRNATWDGTDRKVFTVPVALSMMVFFALCAQCAASLAVIKRETNSWRWPVFTFVYMTVLAYVGALATYQVGTWIGG